MLEQVPKWVIVLGVLTLSSFAFYFLDPPHSACQSQIQIFKDKLKGRLFPGKGKKNEIAPAYRTQLENCKLSNSPGGCYELFMTMRLAARELSNLDFSCNETMGEVPEIQQSIKAVLVLMVQIGWGEAPPNPGEPSRSWLELTDLNLFCNLKDLYVRYYTKEVLDELQTKVSAELPGELPIFEGSSCANCEFRKQAKDVLSKEEIWARTLFSTRCDLYR